MTLRLFQNDSYLCEFEAVTLSCEACENGYAAVLDQTAFFPEGGGQPADRGTLNGVEVTDVQEKDGIITHYCTEPLPVGQKVSGKIDFERRFLHMQLHSGEHILSGYIHQLTGLDNVGFHMGSAAVTIDFNGPVPPQVLQKAERLANETVWKNVPIELMYPTREELPDIPFRSKKEIAGQVRLVKIPGADLCACCGTHVNRTGEVGMIKVIDCQNYKGGVRITLHTGSRALAHYDEENRLLRQAGALLKAPPEEVPAAVEKLQQKQEALRFQLNAVTRKYNALLCQSVPEGTAHYCAFTQTQDANEIRSFCDMLCDRAAVAAVFAADENTAKYCIGSRTEDVRPLAAQLNKAFNGRGGGKPEMVQGSITGEEEAIRSFWESLFSSQPD